MQDLGAAAFFVLRATHKLTMIRKFYEQTLSDSVHFNIMINQATILFFPGHLRFCRSTSGSGDSLLQEAAKVQHVVQIIINTLKER